MLWPTFPFDPQETLTSYADRLSMFHTGRGMERILRDNRIHHEHFVSGREEAVMGFAEAIGHPVEEIRRNAIRVFQRSGEFRGEATSKSFLLPQAKRYCPACLADDGGPTDWRFRLLWGFRHVQRCDRHGLWLSATGNAAASCLRVAMNDTFLAEPEDAAAEQPAYLDWLRQSVENTRSEETPWLADQTLEQILAASEMIGAVLQHGHKVKLSKLSPAETEEATDIGFSIYSEGSDAVVEALDTIRQASPASAVQAGPLAHYGALFDWLDRRSNSIDPGPIRDLLRDHIVKHSAVEPGSKVLGIEINERRYHTLYSLSAEVGVERPRLSRLLRKLGEIPAGTTEVAGANMVFEAASTVPLIEAFQLYSTGTPISRL
ncbi:TniQ family protein [Thioclava sp. GXIMD4215]|uniref:TniQ family protein n=1 Tax=Thioclava sp. GXIMD4215 TaxID=3131928 RepID=UPI00311ACB55